MALAPPKLGISPGGALAAVLLLLIGVPIATASFGFAVPFLAGAAWIIGLEVRRVVTVAPAIALAGSFHAIAHARFAEAEEILAAVVRSPVAWVRRIAEYQRAVIALRRGDVAGARDRLDASLAQPLGLFARQNSLYQVEAAHALRAFTRASLGDYEGAREDAEAVRARPSPSAEALARVALAQAVMLEKTAERDALRALLEREGTLLLEHSHPRERAIVRAYQRMLKVSSTTVYRRSAPREAAETGEEPALVDWVHKVAPAAAPFVRVPRALPEGAKVEGLAPPTHAAHDAVAKARAKGIKAQTKTAAVAWIGGVGAAIAALLGVALLVARWSASTALVPDVQVPQVHETPWALEAGFYFAMAAAGLGGAGAVARGVYRRVRRLPRGQLVRLGEARAAIGLGQLDRAQDLVTGLVKSDHDAVVAQARSLEAQLAERRGKPAEMLAACDAGLGRLARSKRPLDGLRAELAAGRAFALGLLDRPDEASAELAALGAGYPMQGRDQFRVRLVELVRRGKLDEAARWVEQGALELPLGVRDELLADLVRAVAAPESAGLGEMERLKDEIRTSPENRLWLEAVAPGLLDRFRRATEGDPESERPAVRVAVAPHDEGEREQLAEAEAESALAGEARGLRRM